MLNSLQWTPAPEVLPKREAPKRLTQARQRVLAGRMAEILNQGEPTKFAFEGACRHGLRSALCLSGWSWMAADTEASQIVAAALHRIGAQRPTWQQGQPEHDELIERDRCVRCGGTIPPDRGSRNGFAVKFCSDLCGRANYANRSRRSGEVLARVERMAAWAAQAEQTRAEREKPCKWCGKTFSPGYDFKRRDFCSRDCANASTAKRLTRVDTRTCKWCGGKFKAKPSTKTKFCGRGCYWRSMEGREQPERVCPVCKTRFRAHSLRHPQVHCSRRCAALARRKGQDQKAMQSAKASTDLPHHRTRIANR